MTRPTRKQQIGQKLGEELKRIAFFFEYGYQKRALKWLARLQKTIEYYRCNPD